MTDEELIARLRDEHVAASRTEAADRIEALTEQLAAARQDAVEAEAYAEELEAKLSTCEKYRDAYDEMGRIGTQAVRDLEAKLAKAVQFTEGVIRHAGNSGDDYLAEQARTTLAEIKGESHDPL